MSRVKSHWSKLLKARRELAGPCMKINREQNNKLISNLNVFINQKVLFKKRTVY